MLKLAGRPVGGIVAGIGVLMLVALVAIGMSGKVGESATEHAQKTVGAHFLDHAGRQTASVGTCRQVLAGGTSGIFRCAVVTPRCRRTFLFTISRKIANKVVPYDQSQSLFQQPCTFASDPADDLR